MKASSLDRRARIVGAVASGLAPQEVAHRFAVGLTTVKRYVRRAAADTRAPTPSPGRPRLLDPAHDAALQAQRSAHPDATRVVFLDEARANLGLPPRFARAPKGHRAQGSAPRNWGPNTRLVTALTPSGLMAPRTRSGAIDRDAFAASVRHVLLPTLRPGQSVICDTLSVHTRADIRTLIEQAGCTRWFLPADSPDFTPIEVIFSQLAARTQEPLEVAIAAALATSSRHDALNCVRHCGYHCANLSL